MHTSLSDPDYPEALQKAAEWQVILTSGETTPQEQANFHTWLNGNEAHRQAYEQIQRFWSKFDHLDSGAAHEALRTSSTSRMPLKKAGILCSVLAAFALSWALLQSTPAQYYLADYRTSAGEKRVIELSDQTRITLNTYSAIDVDYANGQRHITLHQGEILLDVAKDSTRPFVVETRQGSARALGTRYLVRALDGNTRVAVIESRVRVCTTKPIYSRAEPVCIELEQGQGVPAIRPEMQPGSVNIDAMASWTQGYMTLDNQPLVDVLRELERYRPGRIHFDAESLSDLMVSGVLPLNDTGETMGMLTELLPVEVNNYLMLTIVRRR